MAAVSFVDYTKVRENIIYDVLELKCIQSNQVEAIDQAKTLARINFFVTNTVSFLNHFSTVCEDVCLETVSF
jgi:hypothetical protein